MFLATTELTPEKITAFAALFFIIMALLRLVSWMVKSKYGKNIVTIEDFDKFRVEEFLLFKQSLEAKFREIHDQMEKLVDVHCGNRALGKNGVPRWYFKDDTIEDISETTKVVRDIYKQCQQCSKQCSQCQDVMDYMKNQLDQLEKGVDDGEPL